MLLTSFVLASALAPTLVETKITAASLFKNGYAVVLREAPFGGEGEVVITDPPQGVLGTLWVTATPGVKIESVVATTVPVERTHDLGTLDALLAGNVGKRLTVFVIRPGVQEPEVYDGVLKSAGGSIFIMDMDNGVRVAVPKSEVSRIASSGGDELVFQGKHTDRQNALRVRATGAGKILVMSLQRGMTWAPGYHVDITDPKKLTVTSKATILNDLQKLDGVDLKLITGFPNVRFINILDPLTSMQSIDQFVNGMLAAGGSVMDASPLTQNAMMSQGGGGFGGRAFEPFNPGQLEGLQLEDLFFYTLPKVTLEGGERGYYVLFQESAAYEHVYTLDLPETGWSETAYNPRQQQPVPPNYDVWHTLEFTNPSKFPLTTAAATTFKQGEVIGQDMLSYTAPNGKATLRITKALDVQNDLLEVEVSRTIAALKATSYSRAYDLVVAKGTVELVNRKTEAVKMKVTKDLVGDVTAASNAGVVTKSSAGLRSVNPNSTVRWTVTLKPGEKLTLTYDFKVYVQTP